MNRAARIMAAGHGGQVLLSQTTADVIGRDVVVVDLYEHRFAGSAPLRVFQLGTETFAHVKAFRALCLLGWIDVDGKQIILPDLAALKTRSQTA